MDKFELTEYYQDVLDALGKHELEWHERNKKYIDNWIDNDKFDLYSLVLNHIMPDDYDGGYTPTQNADAVYTIIKLSDELGWDY